MGKKFSVAAAALPLVLTAFGTPLPLLAGGLSTLNAVVNALPLKSKALGPLVRSAGKKLDEDCASELSALGAADRECVQDFVITRLNVVDRDAAFGQALLGFERFGRLVIGDARPAGWGADLDEYLSLILDRVHGFVLKAAQSPDFAGRAGTHALRSLVQAIDAHPTTDVVLRLIRENAVSSLAGRPLIVGARPLLSENFVAREETVQLERALANVGAATLCSVHGMRGAGKSQLAAAFAKACEDSGWTFVIWAGASSRAQLVSELAEFAEFAGVAPGEDPETAAKAMVVRLNGATGNRLLVLDNVEDIAHLEGLLPRGPGMRVIVTSTNQSARVGEAIELNAFSPDEGAAYLISATGRDDRSGAAAISDALGHLPLALSQASAAIKLLHYSFEEYAARLDEMPLDEVVRRDSGDPYPAKVGAALRIAYSAAIQAVAGSLGPEAEEGSRSALAALSMLAESGVPRAWLHGLFAEDALGREAIGLLVAHSIVSQSTSGDVIALHRLQAQVIREDVDAEQLAADAIRALETATLGPRASHVDERAVVVELQGQLVALLTQRHSGALLGDIRLLSVANHTSYRGNELSYPYAAIALAWYVANHARILGPDHPNTLASRNNLAGAYLSAGNLGQAIPLYQTNLADRKRVLGPDHPDTLASRNNLAYAYQSAGNVGRAIPLYQANLADRERVHGPNHPNTLASRNNLAGAYLSAGNPGQAIPLHQANLADSERILGPDHPNTLASRNNLAGAYLSAGDLDQAIPLYQANLADSERILGPDHPNTLISRNNLASAYRSAGDPGQAIPLHQTNLADRERILGPDHPNTLTSRNNLASAYQSAGSLGQAIPLHQTNLADRERILGPDHPDTLASRKNLAEARAVLAAQSGAQDEESP